jgi:hypothetical protein
MLAIYAWPEQFMHGLRGRRSASKASIQFYDDVGVVNADVNVDQDQLERLMSSFMATDARTDTAQP